MLPRLSRKTTSASNQKDRLSNGAVFIMTTDNDRELLELAAKAAGYPVRWYEDSLAYGPTFGIEVEPGNPCGFEVWNPLIDDGDALRLAVKLEFMVDFRKKTIVYACLLHRDFVEDQCYRRAIVRAAADIGRAMP